MHRHEEDAEKAVIAETITRSKARMRPKGQLTVPNEIREALHIAEGDEVEFVVNADGQVILQGLMTIPADQAWFWTPEWQAGEREASADIAAGRGTVYYDTDSFLESLGPEDPS